MAQGASRDFNMLQSGVLSWAVRIIWIGRVVVGALMQHEDAPKRYLLVASLIGQMGIILGEYNLFLRSILECLKFSE